MSDQTNMDREIAEDLDRPIQDDVAGDMDAEGGIPQASGGYDTPIDETQRKTGMAIPTGGKQSAEQESGDSDPFVEGAGNQGTEKR